MPVPFRKTLTGQYSEQLVSHMWVTFKLYLHPQPFLLTPESNKHYLLGILPLDSVFHTLSAVPTTQEMLNAYFLNV